MLIVYSLQSWSNSKIQWSIPKSGSGHICIKSKIRSQSYSKIRSYSNIRSWSYSKIRSRSYSSRDYIPVTVKFQKPNYSRGQIPKSDRGQFQNPVAIIFQIRSWSYSSCSKIKYSRGHIPKSQSRSIPKSGRGQTKLQ